MWGSVTGTRTNSGTRALRWCWRRGHRCTSSPTILGHSGIAITKATYGHLVVEDERAPVEAMSGALFGG
ncbi:hypothetical protein GCM10009736_81440 [Actinomadura bangladeshensis]